MRNFLFLLSFFHFFNGQANGSCKWLQIVTKFQKIFIAMDGDNICLSSFLKMLLPFSPFPGGENTQSFFSKTIQLFRELYADYDQGTLGISKVCDMNGSCHTTSSPFLGEKCVTWKKTEKTLNISDTIQPIFIMFHQNDRSVQPSNSGNR